MKSLGWLWFKIATSFVIAGFGVVALVRLSGVIALSPSTLLYFLTPVVFIIAGIWRGLNFLRAVRSIAKI